MAEIDLKIGGEKKKKKLIFHNLITWPIFFHWSQILTVCEETTQNFMLFLFQWTAFLYSKKKIHDRIFSCFYTRC